MCHHMIVFLDGSSLSWHRSNDFSGYGFPLLISNGVIGCSSTSVLHCLPQWLHFKFLTTCIWWCGAHHGNVWTVLSVAWCNSNDPAVVSWIQLLLWWTFSFVPSKFHAVLTFSTKGSWCTLPADSSVGVVVSDMAIPCTTWCLEFPWCMLPHCHPQC